MFLKHPEAILASVSIVCACLASFRPAEAEPPEEQSMSAPPGSRGSDPSPPDAGDDQAHRAEAKDERTKRAASLWREGIAAANHGRYEAAREAFRQAYEIVPDPALLQNMGEAELSAGHYAEAARHLSAFLRSSRQGNVYQRNETAKSLELAERKSAKLVIFTNVDRPEIRVDGNLVNSADADHATWYVDPGRHVVEVQKRGYSRHVDTAEVAQGKALTITVVLEREQSSSSSSPEPASPPAQRSADASGAAGNTPAPSVAEGTGRPTTRRSPATAAPSPASTLDLARADPGVHGRAGGRRIAGYAFAGAGAASIAVGVVEAYRFFLKGHDLRTACPDGWCADYEGALQIRNDATAARTVAIVASGIGIAALATGAVLLWGGSRDQGDGMTQFALAPSFHFAGASAVIVRRW